MSHPFKYTYDQELITEEIRHCKVIDILTSTTTGRVVYTLQNSDGQSYNFAEDEITLTDISES